MKKINPNISIKLKAVIISFIAIAIIIGIIYLIIIGIKFIKEKNYNAQYYSINNELLNQERTYDDMIISDVSFFSTPESKTIMAKISMNKSEENSIIKFDMNLIKKNGKSIKVACSSLASGEVEMIASVDFKLNKFVDYSIENIKVEKFEYSNSEDTAEDISETPVETTD